MEYQESRDTVSPPEPPTSADWNKKGNNLISKHSPWCLGWRERPYERIQQCKTVSVGGRGFSSLPLGTCISLKVEHPISITLDDPGKEKKGGGNHTSVLYAFLLPALQKETYNCKQKLFLLFARNLAGRIRWEGVTVLKHLISTEWGERNLRPETVPIKTGGTNKETNMAVTTRKWKQKWI